MAVRTLTLDVSIRQESSAGGAIMVIYLLRTNIARLVKLQEKVLRDLVMQGKGSAGVIVEQNP
jgi:hypothetical protein